MTAPATTPLARTNCGGNHHPLRLDPSRVVATCDAHWWQPHPVRHLRIVR